MARHRESSTAVGSARATTGSGRRCCTTRRRAPLRRAQSSRAAALRTAALGRRRRRSPLPRMEPALLAAARGDPWRELHDAGVAAQEPSVVGEAAQAEEARRARREAGWVVGRSRASAKRLRGGRAEPRAIIAADASGSGRPQRRAATLFAFGGWSCAARHAGRADHRRAVKRRAIESDSESGSENGESESGGGAEAERDARAARREGGETPSLEGSAHRPGFKIRRAQTRGKEGGASHIADAERVFVALGCGSTRRRVRPSGWTVGSRRARRARPVSRRSGERPRGSGSSRERVARDGETLSAIFRKQSLWISFRFSSSTDYMCTCACASAWSGV